MSALVTRYTSVNNCRLNEGQIRFSFNWTKQGGTRESGFRGDAHVHRFPPEVKDLLASDAREQSLRNAGQVAVQPRGVILGEGVTSDTGAQHMGQIQAETRGQPPETSMPFPVCKNTAHGVLVHYEVTMVTARTAFIPPLATRGGVLSIQR